MPTIIEGQVDGIWKRTIISSEENVDNQGGVHEIRLCLCA